MHQDKTSAARLLPSETWSQCYRCGAEIPEFEFFDQFLLRGEELLNRFDRIQILKELRQEIGCQFALTQAWVSHKTFDLPEPTPCPHCGKPLQTAPARQCRFCRRGWH